MKVQQGNSQQVLFTNYFVSIFNTFRLRGPRKSYLWKRISELHKLKIDIQTAHAKLGSQDGNSREH
jgi:hypothetical protein